MMIRRHKTTIFLEAKETTPVSEIKKMIEGILKKPPTEQKLYNKEDLPMDDDKCLSDYGITSVEASVQNPIEVGLALMIDGVFEVLEKTPYSTPPELPDLMKPKQ